MLSRSDVVRTSGLELVWTLVLALCWLWTTPGMAQDPTVTDATNVGFPMNGAFDGTDFESVQVTNGNLHIELPLWSTPGRNGLGVTYKYVYDSKKWSSKLTYDSHTDTWRALIRPEGGLGSSIMPTVTGPLQYTATGRFTTGLCNDTTHYFYTNYVLGEPDGTKHHFLPDPMVIPGQSTCFPSVPSLMYAEDGSGWALKVDPTTAAIQYAIDKNGMIVRVNSSPPIQDTNGNQLTGTDTLGRDLSNGGLAYYDSSGAFKPFRLRRLLLSFKHISADIPARTSVANIQARGTRLK